MGESIQFPSNGSTADGYVAGSSGPGIVVIQEWWGLNDHIRDVCDRFAAQGFVALAPDLYHGTVVDEPDEAGKEMMALDMARAAKDLSGAVDEVARRSGSDSVGVVGYCMGGGLALVLACQRPDKVKAVAPYYGVIPWPTAQPDYSKLEAAVEGHYAENDSFANPDAVRALEAELRDLGKDASLIIHSNTEHAFFNDTRPEVYDDTAAKAAFNSTVDFFRTKLGS